MKMPLLIIILIISVSCSKHNQEDKDRKLVNRQQEQYAIGQPIPSFDWSLERHLVSQLYMLRNKKVTTHAVWRSNYGMIEGDCPSMGYGIPYDTSLSNPLRGERFHGGGVTTIEQAEPNGVFASKNTQATWVMCLSKTGAIEPVYIESKVSIYPGKVKVDYKNNRVKRTGTASITISDK